MTTINYSKKAFSNQFDLFNGDLPIGFLRFSNWKGNIESTINGKNYVFSRKGFWKQGFNVYQVDNQLLIAEIEFAVWKQKTQIILNSERYILKKSGFWGSKWELDNGIEKIIEFHLTKQFWNDEGIISFKNNNSEKMNLLALIGLATINIYRRRAAAAAAA